MTKVTHTILPPSRNSDAGANVNAMHKIQDGSIQVTSEKKLLLQRRPGSTLWINLGTDRIDGQRWFEAAKVGIVVSGGKVYKITNANGDYTDITGDAPVYGSKCVFAEVFDAVANETRLFIANTGPIIWTNGTTTTYVTGDIAPARCSHVAQVDTYLCFNDMGLPGFWKHSAEGEPTNMTAGQARTMTAQRIPDDIVALFALGNKLYVCGTRSVEPWQNTGDTIPFSSLNTVIDTGLNNKDSVSVMSGIAILFNADKRLIQINGFTPNILSQNYQAFLDTVGSATNIETEFMAVDGGKLFLLVRMQDQDVTVVYDVINGVFYEWSTWNTMTNKYEAFYGRCYSYMKDWGFHIIGDGATGKLYKFSEQVYKDDTKVMKSYFEFGNQDHGTSTWKNSQSLLISIKRGTGLSLETPATAQLQFRDNGNQPYGNIVDLDLGITGDTQMSNPIKPMGRYKSRQLKITMGDNSDFVLYGIEEEVSDTGRY